MAEQKVTGYKKLDPSSALLDDKHGDIIREEAGIEPMLPVEQGASRKDKQPIFKWEIINTPKTTTIHINVERRLSEHFGLLELMGECLNNSLRRYLVHVGVDGKWMESQNSFCVRISRSFDSVELAKLTLADFERGLWTNLP